jgi:hypothetical protein
MKLTKENIYDAMCKAKELLSNTNPLIGSGTFVVLSPSSYDKAVEYLEGIKSGKIKLSLNELFLLSLYPLPDSIIESVNIFSGKTPRWYIVSERGKNKDDN